MSERAQQSGGGQASPSLILIICCAFVLIPLAWGVYLTLKCVVALFTG